MRIFLFSFFLLALQIFSFSQGFEGKIYFQKNSISDTSYFTFSVKENNIRIDEFNKSNLLTRSVIFDVTKKIILVLNPAKQLYTYIAAKKNLEKSDNCLITKSNNYRIINGLTCYQWRVKNVAKNTEVTYWVAKHNFSKFDELLRMWHSLDNTMDFYLELPIANGHIPMLSVERTLLRDEKVKFSVLQIQETKINEDIFKIPEAYKSFQTSYK